MRVLKSARDVLLDVNYGFEGCKPLIPMGIHIRAIVEEMFHLCLFTHDTSCCDIDSFSIIAFPM